MELSENVKLILIGMSNISLIILLGSLLLSIVISVLALLVAYILIIIDKLSDLYSDLYSGGSVYFPNIPPHDQ